MSGATVIVAAYTPSTGYAFSNWTSSESATTFASSTMSATSFVMPAKALTITANYITNTVTSNNPGASKTSSGTVTSSRNSNTGTTSKGAKTGTTSTGNGSSGNGTKVDVEKNGFSNTGLASATVSGSTDDFVVKVKEDATATEEVAKALKKEYGDLKNIRYTAMDISLYDSTGTKKVTDTSGMAVTITLPIPDELKQYAGNNQAASVINTDQLDKLTPTFSTINDVTCITFTAKHFSPYTIYVDTSKLSSGVSDATPKTGDALQPKWFLAAGLALLSAVLFLKKDKKTVLQLS